MTTTGERRLTQTGSLIARRGRTLTVYRQPSAAGGAETSQSVGFIVNALSPRQIEDLRMEGVLNVKDGNPKWFVCAGDEDVREAVDEVLLPDAPGGSVGWRYRLVSVEGEYTSDTQTHLNCLGVRNERITS